MYLWLKALHVIAIISWMAGLLYIWRLYVYHAMETERVVMSRFEVMERRLLNAITTPAGVVSVATGVWMLVLVPAWLREPWMHVKLTMIVLMIANHGYAIYCRHRLLREPHFLNHKWYRVLNEVPTLLMIVIVIMVITRPLFA